MQQRNLVGLSILSISVLQLLATDPNDLRGGYDETRYVLMAEVMVAGGSLELPRDPQYPPGWPALLGLNFALGGGLIGAHRLNLALTVAAAAVLLAYLRHRRQLTTGSAAVWAAIFVASRWTWYMADSLLAEPLFALMLFSLMLLIDTDGPPRRDRPLRSLAVGALALLLRAVRTVGLACSCALFVQYLILDRQESARSRLVRAGCILLPFLAGELLIWGLYPESSFLFENAYVSQTGAGHSTIEQVARHFKDLASACVPYSRDLWHPGVVFAAMGASLAAAGVLACVHDCLVNRRPASSLVCAYLLLVVLWPYYSARFFWPVAVYVQFMAITGCSQLAITLITRRDPGSRNRIENLPAGIGLLLAVTSVAAIFLDQPLKREITANRDQAFVEALGFLDEAEDRRVTVATYHCFRTFWHRRDWLIVPLSAPNAIEQHEEQPTRHGVVWAIVENERLEISRWTEAGWEIAFDNGRATVLRKAAVSNQSGRAGS